MITTGEQIESCMNTFEYILEKYKAEFKRASLVEKAKPNHKQPRPMYKRVTQEEYDLIMEMSAKKNMTADEIAAVVGCSKNIVYVVAGGRHPLSKKKK